MLFSDIASIKFTIRIYLQPTTTLLTATIIPHILIPAQSCPFCGQVYVVCAKSIRLINSGCPGDIETTILYGLENRIYLSHS